VDQRVLLAVDMDVETGDVQRVLVAALATAWDPLFSGVSR
jgi:hypothetical protein